MRPALLELGSFEVNSWGFMVAHGVGRVACQLAGEGTYGVASDLP